MRLGIASVRDHYLAELPADDVDGELLERGAARRRAGLQLLSGGPSITFTSPPRSGRRRCSTTSLRLGCGVGEAAHVLLYTLSGWLVH